MIEQYFDLQYGKEIRKYCDLLEKISKEYDILIFMARKAICFFEALLENHEVTIDSHVVVASSRIIQYDCAFLRNKKIALIDDIIVKGNTLQDTRKRLEEIGVEEYSIYCIASPLSYAHDKDFKCVENIWRLNETEILVLGNSITNYINSATCSYNIDYPVFEMSDPQLFQSTKDKLMESECFSSIPNSVQGNLIEMYVQSFVGQDFLQCLAKEGLENVELDDVITKVRFYINREKNKIVAIPIVILPELTTRQLESLYMVISGGSLRNMLGDNEILRTRNMLNVILYALAYSLFSAFNLRNDLGFTFAQEKIGYVFPNSHYNEILQCLRDFASLNWNVVYNTSISHDIYDISNVFCLIFDFIGNKHNEDISHSNRIVFSDIVDYCRRFCEIKIPVLKQIISTLFDYAIDSGLIVPEVFRTANGILRAYRLSEQYELKEKEFDLILYMYNEYLKKTKRDDFSKIMSEKLLVLFFRDVISKLLCEFRKNDNVESKDVFGIAYARFGPVVSDCANELNVRQNSYLTERLKIHGNSEFKRIKETSKARITIKKSQNLLEKDMDYKWKIAADSFVDTYAKTERTLNYYKAYDNSEYIKSIDKFLTLTAIGTNKENQLLAIASEIKMLQFRSFRDFDEVVNSLDDIMTGLESGAWKYLCFKSDALSNMISFLYEKNKETEKEIDEINLSIEKSSMLEDRLNEYLFYNWDSLQAHFADIEDAICQCYPKEPRDKVVSWINDKVKEAGENKKNSLINLIHIANKNVRAQSQPLYKRMAELKDEATSISHILKIFYEMGYGENKNDNLLKKYIALMDECGFYLYEVLSYWRTIVEKQWYALKPKNTNKNSAYIKKLEYYLKNANADRWNNVSGIVNGITSKEDIFDRIKEIYYETYGLLTRVNETICMKDVFYCGECGRFYVLRRDDGNTIDNDEVTKLKQNEIKFNSFFKFDQDNSIAVFKETKRSKLIADSIINSNYEGYTFISYCCNKRCNAITEFRDRCYSDRVYELIHGILNENENCIMYVTD
ncbi:MAG: phosphoribosyltransferase [Lachnospiraceae bacterium]|nr:phosphoribosyltransferase [Lachnospiraceae bacterium]